MIKNVTAEDSGNYSCSARDNPGQQVFLVSVGANSTLSGAYKLNINLIIPSSLSISFTVPVDCMKKGEKVVMKVVVGD